MNTSFMVVKAVKQWKLLFGIGDEEEWISKANPIKWLRGLRKQLKISPAGRRRIQ